VDRTVRICSVNPNTRLLQPFQQLRAGMPVGITFSGGDDPDLRLHGREKFRHCRVFATVVADFQNVRAQPVRIIFRENGALGFLFRVPRQ